MIDKWFQNDINKVLAVQPWNSYERKHEQARLQQVP